MRHRRDRWKGWKKTGPEDREVPHRWPLDCSTRSRHYHSSMVLHIESYLSRRDAARLEARHRAADINVGLTPIRGRDSYRQFDSRRSLFPFGLRELLHWRPIRKDQSGSNAAACQHYLARFKGPARKLSISYRPVTNSFSFMNVRRKFSERHSPNASYSNDSQSGSGDKTPGQDFPNIFSNRHFE